MTEELAKDVSGAGDPGDKVEALVAAEEKTRKEQQLPRVTQNKDGLANFNLINPFVHTLVVGNLVDFAQILVGSLILFPLRVLGIIVFLLLTWVAALIGLYGMSKEDIAKKPLTGWRKECRNVARTLLRGVFFFGSFHRIKCIGKQAPAREAPIVVVAPHSSFFDSLVALVTGPPSVVAKAETADLPFFGKLIDFTQPIYVCREDPNSRQNTIQAIKERASSTEDWPPLLIFPEGTCTNRSALISFKLGAFYPGVPIQPVIVRYPNRRDSFTWTWCGPGPMHLLWLTLTKAFSNVEVEYLPVYVPSEEEKQNPKLYAQNVRQVMSKALDMPISDYTYTDCKTLARAKDINLKRFLSAVEVDKMRQALGLNRTNIEEQIVATSASDANLRLNFDEFCRRLKIAENEFARRLFDVFAVPQVLEKEQEEVDGPGDEKKKEKFVEFREYLLFALFLIKFKQPNIQLLELAFKLHGGAVTRQTFTTTICQLLGRKRIDSAEAADALFNEIRKAAEDKVTFDEFSACVEQKPKFSCLFSPPKDYAP